LQRRLVDLGVPRAAIVEELLSLSTFENAIFSAATLRALVPGSRPTAAIVTCPWHMARALASFRAAGVEALPFPTGLARMSPLRRARVEVHEIVCRALDARAMARADLLADHAEAFAHRRLTSTPVDMAPRASEQELRG
jgi:vancomycin permeability regulator SanA